MADKIFNLLHNTSVLMANVKVRNAMNPIVIGAGVLGFPAAAMMLFGVEWVKVVGAVVIVLLVVALLAAYFYLMVRNPQMLQSEEFQIKKQALEIIQQQGTVGQIAIADTFAISCENKSKLPPEGVTA